MTIHFSEDPKVQEAVEVAAKAACDVLDQTFPGHDAGGITSNFQGLLVEVLTHMLTGRSLLDAKRGHYMHLPALVLDDAAFGNPLLRGELFGVTRKSEPYWQGEPYLDGRDGQRWRQVSDTLVLSDLGSRFVPLADGENINPFTSFDAAVRGAVEYLRASGEDPKEARLEIKPLACGDKGYVLASPASGH